MPLGEYLEGMLFFVPTLGATLAAAYLLVRKRFDYLRGLSRVLGGAVIATAGLVAVHVIPAALGILARPSVLVAALALLAAAYALPAGRETAIEPQPQPAPSGLASMAIAAVAVGAVVVYELARLRLFATQPVTDIDMLGFHLPGVARWIQTGTLWQVDQFEPGFATAQYPNNGDFLILATVLPWRSLAFARFAVLPFFVLTGVGTYALGLELGARRAAAATFGAFAMIVPALSLLVLEGLPDAVTLSMLAVGLVFMVRHARSDRVTDLVLAGLALGLALGTKWFGLTAAAVVVVVWAAAWLLARRPLARVARDAGVLVGMSALAGGIWLVRNVIESGNPVYPKTVSVLGVQLFAGSHNDVVDRFGYTIADYLSKPHILRHYVYPGFKDRIGLGGIALLAGLVVVAIAAARGLRRRGADRSLDAAGLALVIAVLGMFAVYAITPGSAYGTKNQPVEAFVTVRWLMPAIVVAAAVVARAVGALGRAGPLLELLGLAGVIDAIHLGTTMLAPITPRVTVGLTLKVAFVLAVLIAAAILARRWAARRQRPVRVSLLAAGSAFALALVVAGWIDERQFNHHSYARYDPVLAWITNHAPAHHRIGITGVVSTSAGVYPVLPMFGPRLRNYVAYVGDRVRHSLALPTAEGSFDAELRRGRYDLLLVGLQDTAHTDAWAHAFGYRLVTQSDRLALYAAPGAAAPAGAPS
jgi:hypothetical protein